MKVLTAKTFDERFLPKMLGRAKVEKSAVFREVAKIIRDVKESGDRALVDYTRKFDCANFSEEKLRVSEREIKNAYKKLKKKEINALRKAAENIRTFHKEQIGRREWSITTVEGVKVGQLIRPLSSIGVYAPLSLIHI